MKIAKIIKTGHGYLFDGKWFDTFVEARRAMLMRYPRKTRDKSLTKWRYNLSGWNGGLDFRLPQE